MTVTANPEAYAYVKVDIDRVGRMTVPRQDGVIVEGHSGRSYRDPVLRPDSVISVHNADTSLDRCYVNSDVYTRRAILVVRGRVVTRPAWALTVDGRPHTLITRSGRPVLRMSALIALALLLWACTWPLGAWASLTLIPIGISAAVIIVGARSHDPHESRYVRIDNWFTRLCDRWIGDGIGTYGSYRLSNTQLMLVKRAYPDLNLTSRVYRARRRYPVPRRIDTIDQLPDPRSEEFWA